MTAPVSELDQRRRARRRRTKAQMCLWLQPDLLNRVRLAAREQRTSSSALIERFVKRGLADSTARELEETSLPAITEAIRAALDEHEQHRDDRLASLLTRSIIASDTTRRLLFAHMARQWGGAEQIRQAHDSARTASINALREHGWQLAIADDVGESEQ